MCSGVQVVVCVVFPSCAVCGCCDSVEGVGCVLHVVLVCPGCCFVWFMSSECVVIVLVYAYVQRVKSGVFTPQEYIYKKSAFF